MKYMNRIWVAVSLLWVVSVHVDGAEVDLIKGDVLSHFRTAQIPWEIVKEVHAIEGEKEFRFVALSHGSTGILVNGSKKNNASYLYSKKEYKDVAVKMEFMVPKGSNAGLYFMGRYEVQIYDSYGKDKVKFSDLGGIYQRWRSDKEVNEKGLPRGYEGVSPNVNAAKAPGTWQTMEVLFRAPRFDAAGNKMENAKFISVLVNGQLVQKNVEVTGPTRAAPESGEQPEASLVIQGDHGPLAIRSLKIKSIDLNHYN